jgi:hypothetical protein
MSYEYFKDMGLGAGGELDLVAAARLLPPELPPGHMPSPTPLPPTEFVTTVQRGELPWYKQPLVLIGAGILGGLALMKLMEQRGRMVRNPDYKVGDLVVNQMMAIGRVLAVHDDYGYVNVRVKSGYVWTTSNWPYDILMEPAEAASFIAFKRQQGEEMP